MQRGGRVPVPDGNGARSRFSAPGPTGSGVGLPDLPDLPGLAGPGRAWPGVLGPTGARLSCTGYYWAHWVLLAHRVLPERYPARPFGRGAGADAWPEGRYPQARLLPSVGRVTTEPRLRRTPQPPGHGPAHPGDHRTTAIAVLLLAASAAAVTWLLLGSGGHELQTVPTTASTLAGTDRTDRTDWTDRVVRFDRLNRTAQSGSAARPGGDCPVRAPRPSRDGPEPHCAARAPGPRACEHAGRPGPHPPACCRIPHPPVCCRPPHHDGHCAPHAARR